MEVNLTNFTSPFIFLDGLDAMAPRRYLLPSWFFWTYIGVIVVGGFLTNGFLAGYLARRRIYPVVLHLCLTDIASLLFLAPYEILVLSDPAGEWQFPSECCPSFAGLEVLLGTATIYLLIVLNFSSAIGNDKTSLKVPLLTVWLLAISLSVPEFIFAELITPKPQYNICSVPKRAAFLIGIFRLSLPVFLLLLGTIIDATVLFRSSHSSSLYLALVLSLSYIVLSVQRNVFGVLYELFPPPSAPTVFRTPPLADVVHNPIGTLSLAMIHYTLSAVRPMISWSICSGMSNVQDPPHANHVI